MEADEQVIFWYGDKLAVKSVELNDVESLSFNLEESLDPVSICLIGFGKTHYAI